MTYKTATIKAPNYDEAESAVRRAVDLLGGIDRFLKPGWKVLLKPNLLAGAPPEKCVTTHPAVVRAAVNLVREAGCVPVIGDSPSIGSGSFHAKKAGFAQLCREMEVEWVDFEDDAIATQGTVVFKKLEVARIAMETDAIINLAKVKTHGQTYLTLAVKNMFGIIPGVRKTRWHLSAGADAVQFSKMLVEVCYVRKPVLNIADGIMAMDGNGPGAGDPYPLGYIIAGEDPTAVDRVICHMLKVKPSKVPTLVAAQLMGLGETRLDNIEILGDDPAEAKVDDFRFCGQLPPIDMGRLNFLVPLVKNGVISHPKVDHKKCTQCKQCIEHCPAEAMVLSPDGRKGRVQIDLDDCIRCYCCSEICPEGAISVKQGWMWRMVPGFLK